MDKEKNMNIVYTDIFIVIMFTIFPLYVKHQYFDITQAKYTFLLVLTGIYVFGLIVSAITQKKLSCSLIKTAKLSITDYAILLFAVLQLMSSLWSSIGHEALVGKQSRYMGAYTILIFVLIYFLISRNIVFHKRMAYALAIGSVIVYGIAILQNLGFDVFHLYKDILEGTEDQFLSTIGNNNFFASFVCMTYGFFMIWFSVSVEKVEKVFSGIAIVVGSMAVIASGNNGVFIGVIIALLYITALTLRKKISCKNALESILLSLIGVFVIYLLRKCFQNVKVLDSFANGLNRIGVIGIMILVLGVVIIVMKNKKIPTTSLQHTKPKRKYESYIIIGGTAVILLAAISAVVFHIVHIPDGFGTGRGFIWNRLMKTYENASLKNKLFGYGPETIGTIFATQYKEETESFIKLSVNAAHNEYLQYLITVGFVGCLSYLIFLISVIWRGLQSALNDKAVYAVIAMVLGYAAHAFIGIGQPMTTPFLFIAVAILEGFNRMFSTKVVNS